MTTIPLFDPRAVNAGVSLEAAVARVLQRHWYVLGEEVQQFEAAFAAYCGVPHCTSLANGTDALELALRALEVGPGDRILLAANAGYYGSTAVHVVGATPVYVDVDPVTLCLDAAGVERALAAQPAKAVIVTHLYGQMADAAGIARVAKAHGAALIEDCAQAHGARRGRAMAGSIGDVSCFSFYPTKNLGAVGDGGAVVTRDARLDGRVRSLRQYGWSSKYHNAIPGGRNSRLDEMQAAVLNDKLPLLDRQNEARRHIAQRYMHAFRNLPVGLQGEFGEEHVAHLFVIRVADREALRKHLHARGIASDVHYPVPDHLQRVAMPQPQSGILRNTEKACAEVLSLPCYPGMPDSHVDQVIGAIQDFHAAASTKA